MITDLTADTLPTASENEQVGHRRFLQEVGLIGDFSE